MEAIEAHFEEYKKTHLAARATLPKKCFSLPFYLQILKRPEGNAEMLSNFTSPLASKFNLVTVPLLGQKVSLCGFSSHASVAFSEQHPLAALNREN